MSNPFMGWLILPLDSVTDSASLAAMAHGFAATADQAVSSLTVLPGAVVAAVMGVFLVCGQLSDRLHRVIVRRCRLRCADPLAPVGYLVYALLLLLAFAIDLTALSLGA